MSANKLNLPPVETVAAAVHQAWIELKQSQGVTSRPSGVTGKEQMVPYEELEEADKEADRQTVLAVYAAIERTAVTA
jgi:hypothetical protein